MIPLNHFGSHSELRTPMRYSGSNIIATRHTAHDHDHRTGAGSSNEISGHITYVYTRLRSSIKS